jgi:magnesium-transporting ATPase (P-type)
MNSLSNLAAIVASFVLIFFLNYIFYGVVAAEFFENHHGPAAAVMKEEVDMIFIFFGTLIQAVALTLLYARWSQGIHEVANGFRFGALVGVFAGFGMMLIMFGTSHFYDLPALIVDGLWYVFLYGLCGGTIAMVSKRVKARSS